MTKENTPKPPAGMSEASAKFEHGAKAAVSDPLLGIIRKYQEADAASDRAYEALDKAEGAARRGGIKLPRWGLVEFKEEGTQWTLGRDEIERAATSAGHHGLHLTTEQRDTYLAQLDELRRKGLDRYKELGLDTLYLENEHWREAFRESLERVWKTPAVSVEGFAAKVLVFCDHSNEDNVPPAGLARSVKADAERFARKGQWKKAISVLTTAAAASSESDPVAQIGRDLAQIWRQVWRNDDDQKSSEAHSPERNRQIRLEFGLADRREALEAMAVEIQASSLEGAMVQIMLAHAEADLMAANTDESTEAQMRTVSKLLYSALAAIEQVADVPREELGGKAYLTRDLDPHALVAGGGAEGTT
jgi:hypothetical protein